MSAACPGCASPACVLHAPLFADLRDADATGGRGFGEVMDDLFADVSSVDLVEALRLDATARRPRLNVGDEFAMLRELRDRGLTPEGERRPDARGGR